MKKIFVALSMVAFLAACDDSSSASAENNEPTTLSSIEEEGRSSSSSVTSAGSVTLSSSSLLLSDEDVLSRFSSSMDKKSSSSSVVIPGSTGNLTDDRNGQTYKIVKIGAQWWMAENLNYKTDNSFCYNDSAEYCETYGRLYTWADAIGKSEDECGYGHDCDLASAGSATFIQGVCPSGWHLPSKVEWETLLNAVGGQSTAGKVLKSTSGWNRNGYGTDTFSFSALPAGYRYLHGYYDSEGEYANFWSSTEGSGDYAYNMYLDCISSGSAPLSYNKRYGFSVRCVKD